MPSSVPARPRPLSTRPRCLAALAGASVLIGALPAAAQAKAVRGLANDPTGDVGDPRVDIVTVSGRYEPTGAVRVRLTTAKAFSLKAKNELLVTFTSAACEKDLFGVSAVFDDPALPWAYRMRGKAIKTVNGNGTLDGVRYTLTFKSAQLAKLKPLWMQAAIYPAGAKATTDPIDQTDCVPLL